FSVTLGLALGGLGVLADHPLDRLAPFARFPLDLLLGIALGLLRRFLGLALRSLGVAHLASLGDRFTLLAPLHDVGIVGRRPRLELLQNLLSCLGGTLEPLVQILVLEASHCFLSRVSLGVRRAPISLPPLPWIMLLALPRARQGRCRRL